MIRVVVAFVLALATHGAAYAQTSSPGRDSTQQQVVSSYFQQVLDGRKIGLLDQLFLPDCVIHRPEGTLNGMAGIRGVVERNIAAYSQFETQMHDMFESGDRVVARITHRAMGAGEFRSRIGVHDVKGKAVTWDAIAIFRFQNGKIAEQWVNRDELGILLSVGALEPRSDRDVASSQAGGATTTASTAQMPAGPPKDDIYAESGNRLPLVKRHDLDDLGKALYDKVDADVKSGRALAGFQGPLGLGLYSPGVAAADQPKNNYLRFESPIGRRVYELAILVTARELDQQFEWTAHEPAAVRAGVEPAVIDIVKHRRALTGLQPRDAAVIQLGREALGNRVVTSATYAEALRLFGPHDLFDVVSVMAYYSATAVVLNVFDQQLAPGQAPLLPIK